MGRAMHVFEAACFSCITAVDVCFSYFLRIIGPMLIIAANGLILLVTHQYLFVVVPRLETASIVASSCYGQEFFHPLAGTWPLSWAWPRHVLW